MNPAHIRSIVAAFLLLAVAFPQLSEAHVSGTFVANAACEAYQSKNKKTNPVTLVAGSVYRIVATDRSPNPDWYQVTVEHASPQQRWVIGSCGNARLDEAASQDAQTGRDDCHAAGLGDGYVFAVSWQPAFCERHPQKPECAVTDPGAYQAKNFTLHGLWPNKASCGTEYGFCGKQQQQKGSFCNYPEVGLDPSVFRKLGVVMPSAGAGSCLQRHEWYKHGTCQTDWDGNGYFSIAIGLVRQFNDAGMSAFMSENIGKTVRKEDFLAKIDSVFGSGAVRRMKIICSGDNLVDIYISLPKRIGPTDTLAALIRQGAESPGYSCPAQFRVDPIGQ